MSEECSVVVKEFGTKTDSIAELSAA